jgi:hypothetical protein
VVEGGGLENRFPVSGTGVRIPLPPTDLSGETDLFPSLIPPCIPNVFSCVLKSAKIFPPQQARRGAGVVDQERLLSVCPGECRDRGFESHPLRQLFPLVQAGSHAISSLAVEPDNLPARS